MSGRGAGGEGVDRYGAAVLTGATSGIGEATAHRLAGMVDELVLLGPESEEHAAPVVQAIRRSGTATVHYVRADFTHLNEVVTAARDIGSLVSRIDLLINDAAVPGAPRQVLTDDGFERTLQVNALAPALLTRLLVPLLADHARLVNVASSAHRVEHFDFDDIDLDHDYTPVAAYARSKLAMLTWSMLLAEEQRGTTIDVVALCPGLNDTPLTVAMMGQVGGPPTIGAARVLHAAAAAVASGSYLEDDRVVAPSGEVLDPANRRRLARLFRDRLSPLAAAPGSDR